MIAFWGKRGVVGGISVCLFASIRRSQGSQQALPHVSKQIIAVMDLVFIIPQLTNRQYPGTK